MPWTVHGSWSYLPDTGSEQPQYYRFRNGLVTIKDNEIKSRDGATIKVEYSRTYFYIPKSDYGEFDFDSDIEVNWYRRDYRWFGFEINPKIIQLVKAIQAIVEYEHEISWIDIYVKKGEEKVLINSKEEAERVLKDLRANDYIHFGSDGDSYHSFTRKDGKWTNWSYSISEKELLSMVQEHIKLFAPLRIKYNKAVKYLAAQRINDNASSRPA